ncbi:hypothetical protein PHYBLDRAFT_175450 [Phycomyces blakesleeanus NRRL 1555(-)]|uniref:Uncharacterized protein n=1 Tax=Phycomyces blakesleeanus (strain ATCC 8743b / DSM 1359 / FGSC 10004 / NBRC 33097 / NRRL 1555) TaxID=763407 RepID=A0A162TD11_PHYB8|nr:hypothetical protein PHYBLDRAFT_175450 [Phycomyces blakesleeanus NRRL 1555(-)]OAD66153.1 hypothetical protein PHYBLDRAFT_175450 [Phycomyces blakesleeanus NRRL 1555(-)]|eukprot:XP_018284193.1 hypothetical protein PHYBLDRAFT_175450 [Phycomyces blakesleeanus NRRL 1555(-)]
MVSKIYSDFAQMYLLFLDDNESDNELVKYLDSCRYLHKRKNNISKLVTKDKKIDFLDSMNEDDFLKEVRMSKISFKKLCNILTIVLEQLRSNGKDVSYSQIVRRSGGRKNLKSVVGNNKTEYFFLFTLGNSRIYISDLVTSYEFVTYAI